MLTVSSSLRLGLRGLLRRSARPTVLCAGLTVLLCACGLGPSVTGGPTTPVRPSPPPAPAERGTSVQLSPEWGSGPISLDHGSVRCGPGGVTVAIRGGFWVDTAVLTLSGLRAGHVYNFDSSKGAARTVAVTLTLTGPATPGTTYDRPEAGYAGELGQASGTLSVAKTGESGSLDVTPGSAAPAISGHWSCAASQPVVPPTLPVLLYATGPPTVGECWQPGQFAADFAATPISCANGSVNAWAWVADTYGGALSRLGPSATNTALKADLCQLIEAGQGLDLLQIDYQMVQLYYGWHLAVTPQGLVTTDACM